ncbi:MAG TPA: hypothetical protein VGK89_01210 [Candidatus Eisenbacteria bacterium]
MTGTDERASAIREEPVAECDVLRGLERISSVDPRYAARAAVDPKVEVGYRPMTIEDHWNDISAMALHEGVPRSIRVQFETARNLVLYSWFAYRFQQVAEMQAYASVEFALRRRAGLAIRDLGPGLKRLLERAVEEGWIHDEGFRHYRRVAEQRAEQEESPPVGTEPDSPVTRELQAYVKILAETLPFLRNELAHGSAMLSGSAKRTLALCCDLINQLFPTVAPEAAGVGQ